MTEPSRGTPRTPSTRLNGVLDAEGLVTDAATAYAAEAAHALGSPELGVSPARLEANLRSLEVLTVNGRAATPWAPLSGFFPVSGGDWVRTHANSPWHRDRLCALLGLPDAANAVQLAAALAERDAAELEALAHAAGALLVRVRDASEAAAILDDAPPVRWATPPSEAGRAGRAPGGSRADRPLRVLDLTTVIAGPTAGRALAAIGADVLRVDDPSRPELPDLFLDTSAGKRSLVLDANARGPELRALAASADIVLLGSRPGALDRFGLGAEALRDRHPGLVTASIRAYPASGSWAERRGFDSLVQAVSGIARAEAAGAERPGALRAQALDHSAGYFLAASVLAAVAGRPMPTFGASDAEPGNAAAPAPLGVEVSLGGLARNLLSRPHRTGPDAVSSPPPAPVPLEDTEEVASAHGMLRRVRPLLTIPGRSQGAVPVLGSARPAW